MEYWTVVAMWIVVVAISLGLAMLTTGTPGVVASFLGTAVICYIVLMTFSNAYSDPPLRSWEKEQALEKTSNHFDRYDLVKTIKRKSSVSLKRTENTQPFADPERFGPPREWKRKGLLFGIEIAAFLIVVRLLFLGGWR